MSFLKNSSRCLLVFFILNSNLIFTRALPHQTSSLVQSLIPLSSVQAFNSLEFTTGKVFLFGGATSDTSASIYNALRESTGKENPKIAVAISGASSLAVGLEAYYVPDESSASYQQLFTDYGFQPSVVILAVDNYEEAANASSVLGKQNIDMILEADVVFFNGGDQSRHSRSWFNDDGSDSDILHALRERFSAGEVVVAGTSAGLAIQSNPTFGEGTSYGYYYFDGDLKSCRIGETLVDDRQGQNSFRAEENGGYMKGFEFVKNALSDSHFDARGRFARLIVAMKSANKSFGIGVDEDTAAYINHDQVYVFGHHGIWIIDSTEAYFTNLTTHFEANNVRINYLTQGDSYNVTSKQVVTSKVLVSKRDGEVYESDDVFAKDEGFKSITSLASSEQSESVGLSYESKPTARVVFRRTSGTKFYRDGNQFAIQDLRLDIGSY